MDKIMERIKSDYKYVTEDLGLTCVGVFLQGSQNYNLQYEGSDIDTKAIVVPTFEDFVLNRKPKSYTHELPSKEHIDIKDIRLMHNCFLKQNINFLEILFTKYKYLNPELADIYQPMFDMAEEIAHYDNYAAVNCCLGQIYNKYKAMEHPYPTLLDKIEKWGYDPKQLHHIFRNEEFMRRYIAGESYADCLITKQRDFLVAVKSSDYFPLEEARKVAKDMVETAEFQKKEYFASHPRVVNEDIERRIENITYKIFKVIFRKELNDESPGI
jgi:predicted nucleotidyltransferase